MLPLAPLSSAGDGRDPTGRRALLYPRAPLTSIPLAPLPDDVAREVAALGAKQVNLYRALAHAPDLLRAWIAFAWTLRGHDRTSRRLRELMILRTALLHRSEYEWHQHLRMAREAGVTLGPVLRIREGFNEYDDGERLAQGGGGSDEEGSTTIAPGRTQISASVTVTFAVS